MLKILGIKKDLVEVAQVVREDLLLHIVRQSDLALILEEV
jgi:hypothetical protein